MQSSPLPPGIKKISSGKPGLQIGIQAITHGDEPAGLAALEFLEEYFKKNTLLSGDLYLIRGNLEAFKIKKRCCKENLNRIMLPADHPNMTERDPEGVDMVRAEQIKPILKTLDYHLDLHSTSKDSVPFSISNSEDEKHHSLSKCLPVSIRSFGWEEAVVGSMNGYVDAQGGVGISVECGSHQDPNAKRVAIETAKALLNHCQVCHFERKREAITQKELHIIHQELIADTKSFHYTKNYSNFDTLEPNELIATDQSREYRAPNKKNIVLIFPASQESINNGGNDDAYMIGVFR